MGQIKNLLCKSWLMLLLATSFTINAQQTFVDGDFTYQVKNQGVSVLSYQGNRDIIDMPSIVNHNGQNYTVVEVSNKLFFKDENVVSINFPATAVTIGDSVCYECPLLSRVVIGDNTKTIGMRSFCQCTKLMLIVLGKSLELIKTGSFKGIEINMDNSLYYEVFPTFVFKGPDYPVIETDVLEVVGGSSKRLYGFCPEEYLSTYQSSMKWKSEWEPNISFVLLDSYNQDEFNNASVTLTAQSDTIPVNNFTYQDYLLARNLDPPQAYSMNFYLHLPIVFNTSKLWNRGTWVDSPAAVQTYLNANGDDIYFQGRIREKGIVPVYMFTPQNSLKINCETLPDAENIEDCFRIMQDQNFKYKIFVRDNHLFAEILETVRPIEQFCYDYYYEMPDNVTLETNAGERSFYLVSIADNAFANSPLVSIEIGNHVEKIGECAFAGSSQLARVIMGDAVEEVKKDAFSDCPNMALVVLGESVNKIDEGNFTSNDSQDRYAWMNSAKRQTFVLKGADYPEVSSDFIDHLSDGNIDVYCPQDNMSTFENSSKWTGDFNLLSYTNDEFNDATVNLKKININYSHTTSDVVALGRDEIENLDNDLLNQEFSLVIPVSFGNDKLWNYGVVDLDEMLSSPTWSVTNFYMAENRIYLDGKIEIYNDLNKSGTKYAYFLSPKSFYRVPLYAWSKYESSAISTVESDRQVKSVRYYNLAGVESPEPFKGANIKVTTYSDGTRTTEKMIR